MRDPERGDVLTLDADERDCDDDAVRVRDLRDILDAAEDVSFVIPCVCMREYGKRR